MRRTIILIYVVVSLLSTIVMSILGIANIYPISWYIALLPLFIMVLLGLIWFFYGIMTIDFDNVSEPHYHH